VQRQQGQRTPGRSRHKRTGSRARSHSRQAWRPNGRTAAFQSPGTLRAGLLALGYKRQGHGTYRHAHRSTRFKALSMAFTI